MCVACFDDQRGVCSLTAASNRDDFLPRLNYTSISCHTNYLTADLHSLTKETQDMGDYFIEMAIPLASGDEKDLSVAPGGKIGFQLIFIDGLKLANIGAANVALLAGPGWMDLVMGGRQFVELTISR